jgi:hypothetical protein
MRPTRERVAHAHHVDYVAHVATTPPLLITAACDPGVDPDPADILEVMPLYMLPSLPNHRPTDAVSPPVALLSAKDCPEPSSYVDALSGPHAPEWTAAMQQEVDSLLANGTWTLVDLPPGRRVVNNMWVYKVKTDHLGQVERFKARFIAKGCSQRHGVDYTETFSPVIRMASLFVMLAISAAMDLDLCLMDIDTAFLYAPIKEDVFTALGFQ